MPGTAFQRLRPLWLASIPALAFGLWLALHIVSRRLIFPAALDDFPSWQDGIQSAIGQRYFLHEPWRWPLLDTRLILPPDGISIAMTDSVPLPALLAKLLRGVLPTGFIPYGLWIALCYALQPIAALLALFSAGERRVTALVCSAIMAGSMPFFLDRTAHASLMGQFLLLLALALYFRFLARSSAALWLVPQFLVAVMLVHPYLLAMAATVLLAGLLDLAFRRDAFLRPASLSLAVGVIACMALGRALHYFGFGSGMASGYGIFSLNILSPIWPMKSSLLGFLPPLHYGVPQQSFEGYAWLGCGLVLLLIVALAGAVWRRASRPAERGFAHLGLVIICVGLTVFAVSSTAYIGSWRLWHIEHVPDIVQTFRSSGRFFWPVGYALLIGAILATRRLPRHVAIPLLAVAALLQFMDTNMLREGGRFFYSLGPDESAQTRIVRDVMAHAQRVDVYPLYGCGLGIFAPESGQLMTVFRLASERALPLNTFYVSRLNRNPDCNQLPPAQVPAGTLEVYSGPAHPPPGEGRSCQTVGALQLCEARP